MPGLALHADFDRDGRLTGSPAERAARARWPGAVVVPNLDRDRRRLPNSVGEGSPVLSDYGRVSTVAGDDELLRVEVRSSSGTLQPGESLHLRCSGVMHTRVALHDDGGRIVPQRLRSPQIFELPPMPADGVLRLTLQIRTIAGAPFGRTSNVYLDFRDDAREEGRFTLTLLRRDSAGVEHEEDAGRFSVAPFILADRTAPARRLYMVRSPRNHPSIVDMRRATRVARVRMVEIDHGLTGGDTWIQDQYQHCMLQGPKGWSELILHLPRLRHENSDATIVDNLEDVVNTHFRSRDVAVFRDLWDRVVPVRAEAGVARPSFRDLESWVKRAGRVDFVHRIMTRYAQDADEGWRVTRYDDWVAALLDLDAELARVLRALDGARAGASVQRERQLIDERAALTALTRQVKAEFPVRRRGTADPIVSSDLGGRRLQLSASVVRRLFDRARQMHASMNYGGNVESTPPVPGAPLGKIILGNATFEDGREELIDPDLLRVFVKQRKQPIVEINTAWLKVGHVDEMMAVVPSSRASGGFAVLHASSCAAMELLRGALNRYMAGLPFQHPDRVRLLRSPSGVLSRLMTDGTSPVTRLFRGKAWQHVHRRARYGEVSRHLEPPQIYLRLCQAFGSTTAQTGFNVHRVGYVPGVGPDRRYPADISVAELIWADADRRGASSNDAYETITLEPSRRVLRDELPGVGIFPIPVLFDRSHDIEVFGKAAWQHPTTAFSPDMANLQVLNGHLLIPKPYGPRMHVDDAISVVREAMGTLDVPGSARSRVGRRLVGARRMTRATYWVEKVAPAHLESAIGTIHASYGGIQTRAEVIAAFRDSFPGADAAELERRIIRPNRRHFDASGYLKRDFARIAIDDGMVDIFELFVAAIGAELGVRVHFVDSWFYHLRDGQIHCGTNVLRGRPASAVGWPDVWDAPDHAFRGAVTFAPDEISVGNR